MHGDAHHHAGTDAGAGVGELGAGDDGAGLFVDARVQQGDAAVEALAGIGVGRSAQRRPDLQHAEIAFRQREIDANGAGVVQGGDDRSGRDQRARRHRRQTQNPGEGRAQDAVAATGFGGRDGGAGGLQGGFGVFGGDARGHPAIGQILETVVFTLRLSKLGAGLDQVRVLLARLKLDQGCAGGDALAVGEHDAGDQLSRIRGDVD
ncbi:hypothetical protein D3C87_1479440 [compost metagenome]